MKKCYICKHKRNIPGDCHIRCAFNWKHSDKSPPKADSHGIKNGWYMFPFNFDPVWQEEECTAFETK